LPVHVAERGQFGVLNFPRYIFRMPQTQAAKPDRTDTHFFHIKLHNGLKWLNEVGAETTVSAPT
jgi:hypothetical protein